MKYVLVVLFAAQLSCSSADVKSSRDRWNAAGITNYKMKLKVEKTGHAGPMGALFVYVRNGDEVSRMRINEEWLGGDVDKCAAFDTVPEMFDIIERVEKDKHDVLNVTYDSTLGYPAKAVIDPNSRALDDELTWEILSLERIE